MDVTFLASSPHLSNQERAGEEAFSLFSYYPFWEYNYHDLSAERRQIRMGQIIDFDANKKRNTVTDPFALADAEFEEAAKRFEESEGEEGLEEFLKAMKELTGEIVDVDDPKVQEMMRREEEREQEFRRRNQEIIRNEPKFDAGLKMQYYAKVMLNLADKIFHTEDGFLQPFDDFSYFMEFYDFAFSKYSKQYPDLEEEYCFAEELTYDVAELERMVMECLEEVIQLKPNDSDKDKSRLLYHGNRMFELYRNMLYYSSEKESE